MELSRIKALIDLLANSAVTELELSEGDDHIRLSKVARASSSAEATPPAIPTASLAADPTIGSPSPKASVLAPMFGVVHLAPAPGQAAFVAAGSMVKPGDTLCLIEAMKAFSPITADALARIEAVLVADQSEVEANQPLFRLGSP